MSKLKVEINERIKKLQNKMRDEGVEVYIITDAEDIWYFTNIEYSPEQRPFLFLVYANQAPLFIVPKLEVSHVQVSYFEYQIDSYFDVTSKSGDNWYDKLATHLKGINHIAIENNAPLYITQPFAKEWKVENWASQLRMVKSNYEIEKIERVCKIASNVVNKTLEIAQTGTTVLETYMIPSKYFQKELAQYQSIHNRTQNAVWPAEFSYMPHSIPEFNSKIGVGANVNIAIFKLDGYAAECERTFFTEKPTAEMIFYFETMMHARSIMLSMLKPGVQASAIESAIMAYFELEGVADKVLHRPGHGIGLNNHEEPTLSQGNDTELVPNMVVSVEPGLYVEGLGGFRHSDTALITSNGYRLLTEAPLDLESLILS
ncbi:MULTISPECIES: Xaa-Pro peptidase family protein [unclassified Enterococcus]|uniref:M24 family metallopeptidase n=1 Tax=unclassified Enterococcus TaxID=2608891 RepID=UPI001553AB56|nr:MULTISPECIES: Xaa-Pro peptidase family protein [unclassified Enterococcus]MBS7578236.1 aminopeptidase P family protein [Enterococcus sp. MMGLQ5-2]MBS7585525.1 aminopeptidase P family protein [Enterococcus sp. MMGLQ5-1]NPD13384.1 aminopeptidase P family protein [Enterococcus sp. MMGLQ5-1]NPD38067.1 aminopeptidase P family protein [Enterococcus sp. MMGLQ5-2]